LAPILDVPEILKLVTLVIAPPIDALPVIVNALVIFWQLLNAPPSIAVTLGGIFNVPREVQLPNALELINNKFPPSATAGIFEQEKNALESIVLIFPAIVSVLVIFEQFSNAEDPMLLTESGMFKVPNDVLLRNALAPIDNKLPPSATAGMREQFPNAETPIV
jgi:hypothetical protein